VSDFLKLLCLKPFATVQKVVSKNFTFAKVFEGRVQLFYTKFSSAQLNMGFFISSHKTCILGKQMTLIFGNGLSCRIGLVLLHIYNLNKNTVQLSSPGSKANAL
jgi:hypothetical protein